MNTKICFKIKIFVTKFIRLISNSTDHPFKRCDLGVIGQYVNFEMTIILINNCSMKYKKQLKL